MDTRALIRALLLLATLLAAGCNPIYKAPVQQGNVLKQDMIDQLRPYMTKRQVELVLGTPALSSAFHNDRWDYMYTMRYGRGEIEKRRFTVVFNDDKLIRLEGDWRPSQAAIVEYQQRKAARAEGTAKSDDGSTTAVDD